MLRQRSKQQKRLAKLILASLLCTGGILNPSLAKANSATPVVAGNATPKTYEITAADIAAAGITSGAESSISNITVDGNRIFDWNVSEVLAHVNSITGDVSGYTVTVKGKMFYVEGGFTRNGNTTGNTVILDGGSAETVYGGSAIYGTAVGNEVIVKDGSATDTCFIVGGTSGYSDANENKVTIKNGNYEGIFGGRASATDKSANENKVTIEAGRFSDSVWYENISVVGGYSDRGDANKNEVTIKGGEFEKAVLGGFSINTGAANENKVTISGGTFKGNVYGGISRDSSANNNIVSILGQASFTALYGGRGKETTGNTLNVAAKNVKAEHIESFQNMNFYLPADIAKDDTMLTVNGGSATDVKGVTFGVAALNGVNLQKGDTVNLLVNSDGLTTDEPLSKVASSTLVAPNNLATDSKYELSIEKKDTTAIIAKVENVEETPEPEPAPTPTPEPAPTPKPEPDYSQNERLKSLVETREAALTMLNAGTDLLAGQGMQNAAFAAGNRAESGGFNSFAAVAISKLRANSGSHVDTKGIGLNLGFAREIENKHGKLLFGPVVEYGHGSYDSYQDNGIKADGNTSYWGIGLLAKQTNNNGMYYEGSIRGGRVKADYDSDLSSVTHASYDSTATYWAAHAGIGKLVDIGHDNTLDLYGKYFYSHTGGDSVTVHATAGDEQVSFSGVNSHRARIGARITHSINEKNAFYGGLGYQYEFSGDARATYNGGSTPSPSVQGSSGLFELGWQVKPGKGPMAIDLGVTGWVGKQRGVTANLQACWTF